MFKTIFDKVNVPMFNRMLNGAAERQRMIAENISNINTPGYKSKDVDFTSILNEQSNKIEPMRTDPRHIPVRGNSTSAQIDVERDQSKELDSGVNNVDVDHEMVKSAENQLYYTAVARITASKFKSLHSAITGK